MWVVIEAGLCSMDDLRHRLSIDDYLSAWQYLHSKHEATQKAIEENRQRATIQQLGRHGGLG